MIKINNLLLSVYDFILIITLFVLLFAMYLNLDIIILSQLLIIIMVCGLFRLSIIFKIQSEKNKIFYESIMTEFKELKKQIKRDD